MIYFGNTSTPKQLRSSIGFQAERTNCRHEPQPIRSRNHSRDPMAMRSMRAGCSRLWQGRCCSAGTGRRWWMRRCSVRHQALRGTLPAATYCWPCWPLAGGCTAPAPPSPVRVPPQQCTCTYAQVHVHASHSGSPMLQLGLPSCDRCCQSSVGLLISESDWPAADVALGTEEVPSLFAGSHTLRYCSIQCLLLAGAVRQLRAAVARLPTGGPEVEAAAQSAAQLLSTLR